MPNSTNEQRKGVLILCIALVLAVVCGASAGYFIAGGNSAGVALSLAFLVAISLVAYILYRKTVFPYYHRLEDANLELHLKQEELLDTKDDLFIKFLGVYDVNYAANSPRLFKTG